MKVNKRVVLQNTEITEELLEALGFKKHVCGYWCNPQSGADYRIDKRATVHYINTPVKDTERWRAFMNDDRSTTMIWFKNIQQIIDLHRAFYGKRLSF